MCDSGWGEPCKATRARQRSIGAPRETANPEQSIMVGCVAIGYVLGSGHSAKRQPRTAIPVERSDDRNTRRKRDAHTAARRSATGKP